MTTTIKIADKAINTTYQDKTGTTTGSGTGAKFDITKTCLLYTSPSPRDRQKSRMPSSA